ncbi:hypothetical protein Tco_0662609 [Tanacetum coccineum]
MLVQPTQDEGASSERLSVEQPLPSPSPTGENPNESLPDSYFVQPSEVPFEQQPDPSPTPSSTPSPRPSPTPIVPDSIPEPTGENLGDHSSNDTSLSGNEDEMTLQNVYDLCISLCVTVSNKPRNTNSRKAKIHKLRQQAKLCHQNIIKHTEDVSLHKDSQGKSFSKKHRVHKESVSKQGRKIAKGESSVQRDPLFDVMRESSIQRDPLFDVMPEDKIDHMETENAQSEGRTREMVDEDKEFDEVRLSTEDVVSTDRQESNEQVEGTEEIFEGTEEQREGTEEKVESIAGQIKGTEDQTMEGIATQASQTSTQTPTSMIFGDDETIATLLLNMSQAKAASKEKEKDIILAKKLQEQEKEQFTIEERAKFHHDIIAAQRKFLARQRSEAIRNRPPTKNQLRNQMMTYLKHVGNFKHSELKSKKFEDIQAMYEKIKRSDEDFIAIGSVEDDRLIKRMNKKDSSKGEEIKQESNLKKKVNEEDKDKRIQEKRKHGTRKKKKSQGKEDSNKILLKMAQLT